MKRTTAPTENTSSRRAPAPAPLPPPPEPPPAATRKQYIRVKCEPDVARRLKALATRNGCSMSDQIDLLVRDFARKRRLDIPTLNG